MERNTPMDRLVCGDVGFGKTELAIRAAFKAVADNKQVSILVPTTILALQHYKTFKNRLRDFPCKVDYINRFRTINQQNKTKCTRLHRCSISMGPVAYFTKQHKDSQALNHALKIIKSI